MKHCFHTASYNDLAVASGGRTLTYGESVMYKACCFCLVLQKQETYIQLATEGHGKLLTKYEPHVLDHSGEDCPERAKE